MRTHKSRSEEGISGRPAERSTQAILPAPTHELTRHPPAAPSTPCEGEAASGEAGLAPAPIASRTDEAPEAAPRTAAAAAMSASLGSGASDARPSGRMGE